MLLSEDAYLKSNYQIFEYVKCIKHSQCVYHMELYICVTTAYKPENVYVNLQWEICQSS